MNSPRFSLFLKDAERFILSYWQIIEQAPLQTYGTALTFCPQTSKMKTQYWQNRLPCIKNIIGIRDSWDPCLQTLEGHSSSVNAVTFSPDGLTLASASCDGTVWLWDTATGAAKQTLEGHTDSVNAATFSPDSQTLASASHDGTVRLWDMAMGAAKQTLEGHHFSVNAVTFSPDGQTLASASDDGTVRLWDTATGAAKQTLEGHTGYVNAVTFSPDGQTLVSASHDRTVRLWDTATGTMKQTFEINTFITSLSFSIDGKYLKTDRGILPLDTQSSHMSNHQGQPPCAIFVNQEWITQDGQNVLWLPLDYRPICSAVYNNKVVLGHLSGQITFLEFSHSYSNV
jgi:WD40 repeat protein